MQLTVISLWVALFLVSCGTTEPASYPDTAHLELPPALQGAKEGLNRSEADDDSVIPDKKAKTGLGDAVYLTTAKPPLLRIRQSFDSAWNTLDAALKQSEIEITDRELDKGLYYVTYDADSYVSGDEALADRLTAVFANDYSKASYVVTVTADGSETQISAALADKSDQDNHSDQKEDGDKTDGAEKLLMFIYETMRDELVEE
jgi:uncharacterized lipoprotein